MHISKTENFLPNQLKVSYWLTTKYWDYESQKEIPYNCDSENVDVLDSGLCIFHEKRYLEGYLFRRDQFGPKEVSKRTERVTVPANGENK
ncbi:MAG: hypothetical protein WAK17_03820 [Candidatus Nitrosopolaris sp.]|jgi:hypothetical protein